MSEPQTEYDTDAEPTPGPWITGHGGNPNGKPTSTIKTHPDGGHHSGNHTYHVADANMARPEAEKLANARLIAAAGTAAQEAKEMGYEPQKAVEALPELLRMMENAAIDLTDLRAFVARNERHNIKTTRSARRVLQKALAKAGADETMIPGDDGEVDDALNRAEGSEHDG